MNENTPTALRRTEEGRMLAGVCSGLAKQFGWDVSVIRLVWAVLAVFTGGTAGLAYILAWVLIPEEGKESSIAQDLVNKSTQNR